MLIEPRKTIPYDTQATFQASPHAPLISVPEARATCGYGRVERLPRGQGRGGRVRAGGPRIPPGPRRRTGGGAAARGRGGVRGPSALTGPRRRATGGTAGRERRGRRRRPLA